tara:strand:+ start:197 stop:517 length:321 start_codon:yes stop_codon:yes gene_type:complete
MAGGNGLERQILSSVAGAHDGEGIARPMRRLFFLMICALALLPAPHPAGAQSLGELRTRLQATLQRNLGRSMIDGALHDVDLKTGTLRSHYPTENQRSSSRWGMSL